MVTGKSITLANLCTVYLADSCKYYQLYFEDGLLIYLHNFTFLEYVVGTSMSSYDCKNLILHILFSNSTINTIGSYWHDLNNRKSFFDDFAKSKGFDPLLPENWYKIPRDEVIEYKVCGE